MLLCPLVCVLLHEYLEKVLYVMCDFGTNYYQVVGQTPLIFGQEVKGGVH